MGNIGAWFGWLRFFMEISLVGFFKKKVKKEEWWSETESNRRHGDFQSPALPTELSDLLVKVSFKFELKLY